MDNRSPATLAYGLTALETATTIALVPLGLLEAARQRLDAVGVCLVAGLAVFGGMVLEDFTDS